jgi:CheY-like chemotaxis protein
MDDDASVREVMGRMLTMLGYEAASVRDGTEAVRMYERHLQQNARFDVVLMDLTVPGGMGGKAAVREILALDPTARAIVMSGYSNDPVMADHAAHGFRGVLPKPVRMSDVRDVIAQVLDPAN